MNNSTTWANKKRKVVINQGSCETIPSNLRHLPLETFKTLGNPIETVFESMTLSPEGNSSRLLFSQISAYLSSVIVILSNLAAYIDAKEIAISRVIAETLSSKTNTSNDVEIIKRNMIIFFNVALSSYIVYNLYFRLLLKDLDGSRMEKFNFSVGNLKKESGIMHFFLKYILCTLSMMITIFDDIFPIKIEKYLSIDVEIDRRIHFIFLFIMVYLIVTIFGKSILNSATNTDMKGIYSAIFIAYAAFTMMKDFAPSSAGTIDMQAIKLKYGIMGGFTPVFIFIIFVIRMIWSTSMISLTALVNSLYLIMISFFTLFSGSLFSKIGKINNFIKNEIEQENDKSHSMKVFNKFVKFIFQFIFEISFLMVFLYGVIDYSSQMNSSPSLQSIMLSICSIFILIIGYIFYKRFKVYVNLTSDKGREKETQVSAESSNLLKRIDEDSNHGNPVNDNSKSLNPDKKFGNFLTGNFKQLNSGLNPSKFTSFIPSQLNPSKIKDSVSGKLKDLVSGKLKS